MTKGVVVFIVIGLFCSFSIRAQNVLEAFARIMDAKTGQPVSYATIQFENSDNGIIANEDGDFRIPYDLVQQDIGLIISSIGYTTVRLKASKLQPNIVNSIFLAPKIEELEMVVLQSKKRNAPAGSLEPRSIVSKAIKAIQINYPTTPHSYISYYRDYQLINDSFCNVNEGILEVFDKGFNAPSEDTNRSRAALYFYDLNQGFYVDSTLLNSQYGDSKLLDLDGNVQLENQVENELELLNIHNPIRNFDRPSFSFIYKLQSDFINNHSFTLQRVAYENEEPLFEISFVSKNADNSEYIGEGRLFISKSSFAIHRLDYKVFSNPNYSTFSAVNTSYSNTATQSKGNKKIVFFEVSIAYKKQKERMYPSYITFNNRFVFKSGEPFEIEKMEFDQKSRSLFISFNKPVDPATINNLANYRIKYRKNKLLISSVELVKQNLLRLKLVSFDMESYASDTDSEDFNIRIKRIKDLSGSGLNQSKSITGYQFREMFTQEVFEDQRSIKNLYFVNRLKSLKEARINGMTEDLNKYWVNSPLKQEVITD